LLSKIDIQFELDATLGKVLIRALCKVEGSTGVEMEALTAVSVAALTLHDMAKGADPAIEINKIHLIEKIGGKSGHWIRSESSGK
jgi:cyclic pyranopterin phosphate synthase